MQRTQSRPSGIAPLGHRARFVQVGLCVCVCLMGLSFVFFSF